MNHSSSTNLRIYIKVAGLHPIRHVSVQASTPVYLTIENLKKQGVFPELSGKEIIGAMWQRVTAWGAYDQSEESLNMSKDWIWNGVYDDCYVEIKAVSKTCGII